MSLNLSQAKKHPLKSYIQCSSKVPEVGIVKVFIQWLKKVLRCQLVPSCKGDIKTGEVNLYVLYNYINAFFLVHYCHVIIFILLLVALLTRATFDVILHWSMRDCTLVHPVWSLNLSCFSSETLQLSCDSNVIGLFFFKNFFFLSKRQSVPIDHHPIFKLQ